MLIREYLKILKEVWYKCKGPINFDWILIKEKNQDFIKYFSFYNYLKNNIFNNGYFLNIITLYFILKIFYDFFLFIWYTLDLFFAWFLKWFFYIIYVSLDKWETYVFKKMYEFRKHPIKSKWYPREKAILAKNRALFFKQFIGSLSRDFNNSLKINERKHSVILKYYRYFSIWIPAILKSFSIFFRKHIRRFYFRYDELKEKIKEIKLKRLWAYLKHYWNKIYLIVLEYILIVLSYTWPTISIKFTSFFIVRKILIIIKAYNMRKACRLNFYRYLYINYFFLYKNKKYILKYAELKKEDLIKYRDEAVSLTFNFYSFNFKFIYLWHCYIKKNPYLSYLEKLYEKEDKDSYIVEKTFKHSSIFIVPCIIWIFTFLRRFLRFIIPIFNKYYVKYVNLLKKYLFLIIYNIISFILYIISLPFIFVYLCYKSIKNIKNSFKYFIIFFKNLFK